MLCTRKDGLFMLRSPIYPHMPCLVCLVFWPTTRARLPVRHLVGLSGRSLRRTLRVQVVAEGLAHPLVTWSTLALGVFPAWSPAWFTISRKEDRGHRANSGYSVRLSPSRLLSQSVFANDLAIIAHYTDDRSPTIKLFSKKNQVHLFFLESLCWHRRESQFFLISLFALREGGHALRGEEMARSCFAAPSTHTCPV